jgi:hypothetical protein
MEDAMNPTVISYVGLMVAASIIIWGAMTLVQHSRRRQRKEPQVLLDFWVIVRPISSTEKEEELNPLLDAYLRGQGSGYQSKSKKPW